MRNGWCCRPHRDPRELQFWPVWAPGLDSKIHPPRQARTSWPSSPPYQPQSALHLFIMRLVVVFIATARVSPVFSIRRFDLVPLPWLHLVLVHAVAVLLCSVFSSPISSSLGGTLINPNQRPKIKSLVFIILSPAGLDQYAQLGYVQLKKRPNILPL